MLTLILLLVVGGGLAYLAQDNMLLVSVNFGPYAFMEVPLFYVIIGSVITGLVLAYVIHLVHVVTSTFELHGKENELKKKKDEVFELAKRVHQLELENERLKAGAGEDGDPDAL